MCGWVWVGLGVGDWVWMWAGCERARSGGLVGLCGTVPMYRLRMIATSMLGDGRQCLADHLEASGASCLARPLATWLKGRKESTKKQRCA